MTELGIYKDSKVSCFISDETLKSISFINDLAVATISVIDGNEDKYDTISIIKTFKNSDKEVTYSLASNDSFLISRDIKSIIRLGEHFIVDVERSNYDKTKTYHEHHLFEALIQDEQINLYHKAKIPGEFKTTLNPGLVIVLSPTSDKVCLYSLEIGDIISMEHSMIDDIDGTSFLVTDVVSSTTNHDIKDQLMFRIDFNSRKTSKVHSRNAEGFTNDSEDEPYLIIKERIISDLDDIDKKQLAAKYELKKEIVKIFFLFYDKISV